MSFKTGQIVIKHGCNEWKNKSFWHDLFIFKSIQRHISCDWGDLEQEDKEANDQALEYGDRLLSSYITDEGGTRIWIITDADRLHTTILFPHEY